MYIGRAVDFNTYLKYILAIQRKNLHKEYYLLYKNLYVEGLCTYSKLSRYKLFLKITGVSELNEKMARVILAL